MGKHATTDATKARFQPAAFGRDRDLLAVGPLGTSADKLGS